MGHRGPPKKPTELKLLQGVPGGESKLNKSEPRPAKLAGARPPAWLGKEAKKIWREVAPKLEKLGLLTDIDISTLARYCDTRWRWLQAKQFLDEHGPVYAIYHEQTEDEKKAGRKPKLKYMAQFPQVNIYSSLGKELTRLEQNFGMTPSARAGVTVDPVLLKVTDDRERLFGRR